MAADIQCISLGSLPALRHHRNWSLPKLCSICHLHESCILHCVNNDFHNMVLLVRLGRSLVHLGRV